MKKTMYLWTLLFSLVASLANAGELQKVSLQLRWDHQFQFAGYYAAKWQGYYQAAGFDVDIRSALKPDGTILKTVKEVSEGRADFGIGAADILVGIDQGVPLVVLASIFQQSAAEFYAKEGTVFNSPADLLNLKVARNVNDLIDVELQAMLFAEGINPNKITPYKHEPGIEHIIDSRVDVIPGYRLGAPYEFRLQGIKVKRLRPIAYGIDFYGDSLFTHSRLIEKDPAAVERFRLATLQGWHYALEHPEEIANRIVSELPHTATIAAGNIQEFNVFQIQPVKELTLYPFVETGNMNPRRWQQMYELLKKAGVVKGKIVVNNHLFDFNTTEQAKKERLYRYITITVVLCLGILIISLVFIFLLRRQVRSKTLSVVEAAEQYRSVAYELKMSEERFRLILETVAVVPWEFNIPENRWTYVGSQVTGLLGYAPEEWTTLEWWLEIIHPEDKTWVPTYCADLSSRGEEHSMEYRLRTKDGSFVWVNDLVTIEMLDGKPYIMRGVIVDINNRKKAEEEKHELEQQFQQAQKLESLGVLAGGIAHDFNNILAIIMGYCSLTKMDYEDAEKHIPEIEKAAERAAALCRQMLAYAGQATLTQSQVNTWMLVDEMVAMLKTTIQQNVVINPELGSDVPFIMGDASQLRQVVMNLIINAAEAIGDAEGEIDVKLAIVEINAEQPEKDHLGLIIPAGRYICFEVTDNGCGMDDDTRRKIFEPFYTTKFTGRGLGMSAVLGIIKAHNGALQLESRLGHGTTFKVYLPVQLSKAEIEEAQQVAASTAWQGCGTILLAEDEVQVKTIAIALLQKLGFTVIDAANGKEALELYQQNAADITLVVTDMGMPVMNGYELFYRLKQLDPKLPIIISSGFGEGDIAAKIPREEMAGVINKPYTFDQLRDVLSGVVKST